MLRIIGSPHPQTENPKHIKCWRLSPGLHSYKSCAPITEQPHLLEKRGSFPLSSFFFFFFFSQNHANLWLLVGLSLYLDSLVPQA